MDTQKRKLKITERKQKAEAAQQKKQVQQKAAKMKKEESAEDLKNDPLIGKTVRTFMQFSEDAEDAAEVDGVIILAYRKKSGKGKNRIHYVVDWNDSQLDVEIPNERNISVPEAKKMLVN